MNELTAEAIGEKWLSLSNEERSELLSLRRDNQRNENALDHAPTGSSNRHQTKELGHAQEVLHRARP